MEGHEIVYNKYDTFDGRFSTESLTDSFNQLDYASNTALCASVHSFYGCFDPAETTLDSIKSGSVVG